MTDRPGFLSKSTSRSEKVDDLSPNGLMTRHSQVSSFHAHLEIVVHDLDEFRIARKPGE
jgi:hypothetical protein